MDQELAAATAEAARLQRLGKPAEAIPLAARCVTLTEEIHGPEHPEVARALNALGVLAIDAGDLARAEAALARALKIREKAFGPEDPRLALSLRNLADLHERNGELERARTLYLRALAVNEKASRLDHPDQAALLRDLGRLYTTMGDFAGAEPLLERALAIQEKALGPEHPEVAVTLESLGSLHMTDGRLARARPLLERALSIRETAGEPDALAMTESLVRLARLRRLDGNAAQASPLLARALALVEGAVGPRHIAVAGPLRELASARQSLGDPAGAERAARRALAIEEDVLGPGHVEVAATRMQLSVILQEQGDSASALRLLQRALPVLETQLGPEHRAVGQALDSLATLHGELGDPAQAEQLCRRALAIREATLGPDHPWVADTLNNLGMLLENKAEYDRAQPLLARALAIWTKVLGPEHPRVAVALVNLAALHEGKGEPARAETLYVRALAIEERALGPDHPDTALSRNNLGATYLQGGDAARAAPLLERAVPALESSLGPEHPHVARALTNLAALRAAQGRVAEAVAAAARAADIRDQNAAPVLFTGSEEQKRLYMATLAIHSDLALSLHARLAPADPAAARLALTVLLRRKGRVLDAMSDSIASLRGSVARADLALLERLAGVYSKLAVQLARRPDEAAVERYRKDLAALVEERRRLESEMSLRSAEFRAEQPLLALADVQSAIPDGAALVEIARYTPMDPVSFRRLPPRYAAYVLHPRGEPAFADLGEASAVDAAVSDLRRALADHDRTRDPKPAARALDRLVMAPVRERLGETRWVLLSPDGPLHLVPFGALAGEDNRYLVERYLFSYLTTGRDLLRIDGRRTGPREAALVLAAPAFDGAGAPSPAGAADGGRRSVDQITQRLPPIDGTVEEAREIVRLFPRSRLLLGPEATEEAVKAVHAPGLLHLATHGFFLPELPVSEGLFQGGPGGEATPAERAALLQRENPLLRSGIALAGFNVRKSGSEDGVLTALEVAGLDLHGTRLAVLSTCESGLGEAISGEGVYGLRRALVMAGAETQVISLWQVDTGRTRELMQAYYRRLKGGKGRSEAMREVQTAMLASPATAHPNLWAAFLVSGDHRPMEASWPDVSKVPPGPRGCMCAVPGRAVEEPGAAAAPWLALLLLAGSRNRLRRCARPRDGGPPEGGA